ncbi:hypothetical protein G9C98_008243 [Cotesia typhae]|uniref:RING-type domain-containing protein n=1 Tax=Cotesia typhae TaxID=2053667 RepID=A0A8J5UVR4_9HYME|nr:hypothetical protein G9C98_008243 [Cotesia typhae]
MRYADKKHVIVSNVDNDVLLIGDPEFSKSGQCDTIHISSTANILPDFNGTRLLTFILGQDGHYIKDGFEEISNSLPVEIKAQLTNFINCFNRVWIEGVTPRSMSLYEKVESLNTVPVLFRTTLQNYMGENPSLWKFWKDSTRGNENEGNNEHESIIEEIPSTNCEICITGPREMIVLPCHHYRMCFDCSTKISEVANENNLPLKCPFCNCPAQEFSRVF